MQSFFCKKSRIAILVLIYLFFVVECVALTVPPNSRESLVCAVLYAIGLVIVGLPILKNKLVLKFFILGLAVIASSLIFLMLHLFFDHIEILILSIINIFAFVLGVVLYIHTIIPNGEIARVSHDF